MHDYKTVLCRAEIPNLYEILYKNTHRQTRSCSPISELQESAHQFSPLITGEPVITFDCYTGDSAKYHVQHVNPMYRILFRNSLNCTQLLV